MENDILDSLEDIGYSGDITQEDVLQRALDGGPSSREYTELVSWLTQQLKDFCSLQESVNPVTGPDDASNFLMEVSGFLREYGCPYSTLSDGPITQRLATREARLQLLDFLITELQACSMVASRNPALLRSAEPSTPSEVADQYESDIARHMKTMLIALGFPKPPANITPFQLFSKLEAKIGELMSKCPEQIGKSLMKVRLSDKQWEQVHKINEALCEEYKNRREMLLKRLDVTIQSFMWSDKAKQNENKISEVYQPVRRAMKPTTVVGVPQILAARDDLLKIEKTSSGEGREACAINKVLIPRVPDRGGRAWELEPPPPEMPSFMKRQDAPQGQRPQSARGGGRGRGGQDFQGGGRGGKVQGGWEQRGDNLGGHWDQGGGGYGRPQTAGGGGYYQEGGYQGGGGGYRGGGGGGYQGGGAGYQGGGGGYNQDYYQGSGGGYHDQGGGRGGRGGRGGGRGRGGRGRY